MPAVTRQRTGRGRGGGRGHGRGQGRGRGGRGRRATAAAERHQHDPRQIADEEPVLELGEQEPSDQGETENSPENSREPFMVANQFGESEPHQGEGPPNILVPRIISPMEKILQWMGIPATARPSIISQLDDDVTGLYRMDPGSVHTLAKHLRHQHQSVQLGLVVQEKLKNLISFAKDLHRKGEVFDISALNQDQFLVELSNSADRQRIRSDNADARSQRAKDSAPGALTNDTNWDTFKKSTIQYLEIATGVDEVPLAYIIRDQDHQPGDTYDSFEEEVIAKAPHSGSSYDEDRTTVHHFLYTKCRGHDAEQFLPSKSQKKKNGKADWHALKSHYEGAGNTSTNIEVASNLKKTLHYKTERSFKFHKFLAQSQQMWRIFEENNEPQAEASKLRWLWEKTADSTMLDSTVASLKSDLHRDTSSWTFTTATALMATQVTSAVNGSSISAIKPSKGDSNIYRNGQVFCGPYTDNEWHSLSKEEKFKIIAERKRTNYKSPGRGKPKQRPKQRPNNEIKSIKKQLKKANRKIAALKNKREDSSDSESGSDEGEDPNTNTAGNAFGGRAGRTKEKKKKKKRRT